MFRILAYVLLLATSVFRYWLFHINSRTDKVSISFQVPSTVTGMDNLGLDRDRDRSDIQFGIGLISMIQISVRSVQACSSWSDWTGPGPDRDRGCLLALHPRLLLVQVLVSDANG